MEIAKHKKIWSFMFSNFIFCIWFSSKHIKFFCFFVYIINFSFWWCNLLYLTIPQKFFIYFYFFICSVQFNCSAMSDSLQSMDCSMPDFPAHHQLLLKLISIELVMSSKHFILCHPLLLSSIFPSIRVFSKESVLCIRWPKYWSFSFSISLSNEYSGLISIRMNWLELLAVQGTLKSLLQHHSSKAAILWHSAFLMVQLSYPYMTTGKTIALTRCTFVSNVSAF